MTHLIGRRDGPAGRLIALLAGIWLAGTAAPALAASSADTTAQTTRTLAIPITGSPKQTQGDLTPEGLTVLLHGQAQRVQHVHRGVGSASPPDSRPPWQVVVYFDVPLSTRDGLRKAAKALSREAEQLSRLGPTEIVIADPHARLFLEASRDPATLREALLDVRSTALTTGELQWHRQRFAVAAQEDEAASASRALQTERRILETHRAGLFRVSAGRRAFGPKLLILVQNGHDLNPRTFYDERAGGSFLADPLGPPAPAELARGVAGEGWTVLTLALGPKPTEFADPLAPLFDLARATHGRVMQRSADLRRTLAQAMTWPVLVVELAGDVAPGPLPFTVVSANTGRTIETTRWASLVPNLTALGELSEGESEQAPVVLRLLRPEGVGLKGELRIRTVAGHPGIDRVVFHLDDEVVAEATRSPYSALIDLGPQVRPCELSAVAYSKSGRHLGEDSLRLNMALEPPIVTIQHLEHRPDLGILRILATASAPTGSPPDRVQIFFNQRQSAAFDSPPFEAEIEVSTLAPSDVVRVVAHYPDGAVAEAARVPGLSGPADVLEVNLVELLAMVTPRNRKRQIELERADFRIHQEGQALPIDHFSRWEELRLTLGLVLDTSDSMEEILDDARQAGEKFFANALRQDDEAFVVDFNTRPRLTRHATSDSNQLLQSLVGLEARGDTALYDAIVFALQQFELSTGRRALVVVTDGEDSASYYQPAECVRQARLHGVPVYLIVLGTPPDPSREPALLRNQMIAQRSGGEVFYVSDLDDLTQIYDQIASELRRQYFLAFNAGHTLSPEELKQIEIEVLPKGLSVRTLLASQQRGG